MSSFLGFELSLKFMNYKHELVHVTLCDLNFELTLVKNELAQHWMGPVVCKVTCRQTDRQTQKHTNEEAYDRLKAYAWRI